MNGLLLRLEQTMGEIKTLFNYFNADKILFFVVFLLVVEYIWFTEKNKKIRDFFTWFICIMLAVIWNPVCVRLLGKFINFSSMYRLYFLLPINLTIAVAGTRFIERQKNKVIQVLVLIVMIVAIINFGSCIFNETSTIKTNNYYKLPDETVAVANIIHNDNTFKEKRAVVPYGMSSQINQIYPEIYLSYTRRVRNLGEGTGVTTPTDSDDASDFGPVVNLNNGNVEFLKTYSERHKLNYIVINKSTTLTEPMENIGFKLYKETNEHIVYRKDSK